MAKSYIRFCKFFTLKPKRLLPITFLIAVALFSCRGCDNKTEPPRFGIDTLVYEKPASEAVDTMAVFIDSLIAASAATPTPADDTAALALKARLKADTLSGIISDEVKKEIIEARDYMRQKQNP